MGRIDPSLILVAWRYWAVKNAALAAGTAAHVAYALAVVLQMCEHTNFGTDVDLCNARSLNTGIAPHANDIHLPRAGGCDFSAANAP